jgi:hypothetical protein
MFLQQFWCQVNNRFLGSKSPFAKVSTQTCHEASAVAGKKMIYVFSTIPTEKLAMIVIFELMSARYNSQQAHAQLDRGRSLYDAMDPEVNP